MCYAGLQCGLSHKGWDIIDNSSGRPDIPLYHLRTLPPYITKNASPKARKSLYALRPLPGYALCDKLTFFLWDLDPSAFTMGSMVLHGERFGSIVLQNDLCCKVLETQGDIRYHWY